MLLIPEGVLELNATAAAALQLVDGARSVGEIAGTLSERFEVTAEDACSEVSALLDRLAQRRFIET
jgi:pyrroloquinoline quinone biosynthesis protein D